MLYSNLNEYSFTISHQELLFVSLVFELITNHLFSTLQGKYKEVKARNSQLLKMLQQGESEFTSTIPFTAQLPLAWPPVL